MQDFNQKYLPNFVTSRILSVVSLLFSLIMSLFTKKDVYEFFYKGYFVDSITKMQRMIWVNLVILNVHLWGNIKTRIVSVGYM